MPAPPLASSCCIGDNESVCGATAQAINNAPSCPSSGLGTAGDAGVEALAESLDGDADGDPLSESADGGDGDALAESFAGDGGVDDDDDEVEASAEVVGTEGQGSDELPESSDGKEEGGRALEGSAAGGALAEPAGDNVDGDALAESADGEDAGGGAPAESADAGNAEGGAPIIAASAEREEEGHTLVEPVDGGEQG